MARYVVYAMEVGRTNATIQKMFESDVKKFAIEAAQNISKLDNITANVIDTKLNVAVA